MNGRHVDLTIRTSIGSRHVDTAVIVVVVVALIVVDVVVVVVVATRCPSNSI
jgi:hypothetical protein